MLVEKVNTEWNVHFIKFDLIKESFVKKHKYFELMYNSEASTKVTTYLKSTYSSGICENMAYPSYTWWPKLNWYDGTLYHDLIARYIL